MLLSQPGPGPGQPLSQHNARTPSAVAASLGVSSARSTSSTAARSSSGNCEQRPISSRPARSASIFAASSSSSSMSSGRARPAGRRVAAVGACAQCRRRRVRRSRTATPARCPGPGRRCRTHRRRARTSPRSGPRPPASRHSAARSTPSRRRRCPGTSARIDEGRAARLARPTAFASGGASEHRDLRRRCCAHMSPVAEFAHCCDITTMQSEFYAASRNTAVTAHALSAEPGRPAPPSCARNSPRAGRLASALLALREPTASLNTCPLGTTKGSGAGCFW